MAQGDLVIFDEAKAKMLDGDWASTDNFYCMLITNATVPAAADTTPVKGDYTEVTGGGNYSANGVDLGALSALVTEAAGTMTFDSATNPSWLQNASNPTNAYYAVIYNFTDAGKDAVGFVDLGGVFDMTTGDLTVTWNASGVFTIA